MLGGKLGEGFDDGADVVNTVQVHCTLPYTLKPT